MARDQHHRASKIAEIYKQQVDNLNGLYEQQDRMLCECIRQDNNDTFNSWRSQTIQSGISLINGRL